MQLKPLALKLLFTLAFAGFAAGSAQAQLVANGGFETGDTTGWNVQLGFFGLANVTSTSHSGAYALFFGNQDSGVDNILQSIATTPGSQYQLSFWAAASGGQAWAYVDGRQVLSLPSNASSYTLYAVNFTASSTSTQLKFGSAAGGYLSGGGYFLDDVTVTAVPEPSQWALMGLGLAAMGALVRRQRAAVTR